MAYCFNWQFHLRSDFQTLQPILQPINLKLGHSGVDTPYRNQQYSDLMTCDLQRHNRCQFEQSIWIA